MATRIPPGRKKGTPKTGGQKGTSNKATVEVKALTRSLLGDPIYIEGLRKRLRTGKVAPAVETTLWHYAYGKPKELVRLERDEEPVTFTLQIDRPAHASFPIEAKHNSARD